MGTMNDGATHSLSGIQPEEVSVVDQAANKRRFLVTKKHQEGTMLKQKTEVVSDGKGGHTTVTTKEDAPAPAPASGTTGAPDAPPVATTVSDEALKLRISPEAKAELVKRVDGAIEKLTVLKSTLSGVEEVIGLTEVPSVLIDGFGDVLHLLAEGDGTPATKTPAAKAMSVVLAKGKKQISSAREATLRQAHTLMSSIISELDATPSTPDEVVPPASEPVVDDAVAKSLAKLDGTIAVMVKAMSTVAVKLTEQDAAIAKHGELIAKSTVRVGGGNGSAEDNRSPVAKGSGEVAWPMDMNPKGNVGAAKFGG